MIEITLEKPDDFSIIVETLTRVGVPSKKERRLLQVCFLLHKRGRYYLCHYKELLSLDGFDEAMSSTDIARRNTIATRLADWGLCTVLKPDEIATPQAEPGDIIVLRHADKGQWDLIPKYQIGRKPKSKRQGGFHADIS